VAHQQLFKLFGSIQKVDDNDDGTITVHGIASSESRDASGELVQAEAMREALPDYSKFPALREMHQPMAAGKVTEADVDDDGVTHIAALVVDPIAIVKVRTGVYGGFSIGGKVLKRDPNDRSIITKLRLVEISLVDSPCNPDAVLSMWKADTMTDFKPAAADVIARAKTLAKAAGTQRFKEFLFEAGQELISEHLIEKGELEPPAETIEAAALTDEPAAVVAEEPAAAAPEAAPAAAEEPAAEAVAQEPVAAVAEPNEEDHAGENGEEPAIEAETIEAAAQPDPAAALTDALGKAGDAIAAAAAEPVVEEPASPFADFAKAADALRSITLPEGFTKSLYGVGRLAELISSLACVQECAAWEKESEGDDSAVPEQLRGAVANLGEILIAMAKEEVAELVAGLKSEPVVEIIYAGEGIEAAQEIVDLVKADETLMAAAEKRLAKSAPPASAEAVEYVEKADEIIAAKDGEIERLSKALGDAAPAVEELTKRFTDTIDGLNEQIADLRKRFEDEPLPARTAGTTRVVAKAADAAGGGSEEPNGDSVLSKEQIAEGWNALSETEKGELLIKVALSNPGMIRLPLQPTA
jgi:phage head maturation protease